MEYYQKIKEDLPQNIYVIDEFNFTVKLILMVSLISVGCSLVFSPYFLLKVLGSVLLGLMYAHGIELQHQLLHGNGFKSVALNRLFGTLTGLPMLVSYSHYQARHLWHHRFVGTEKDTEFFQYNLDNGKMNVREFSNHVFDYSFVFKFFRNVKIALLGLPIESEVSCRKFIAQRIRAEYLLLFSCLVGVLAICYQSGHLDLFCRLWLFPLIFIAIPVHFLIEFPEHILCDRSNSNPLINTRSIKGSALSYWFTNGNNFHAEHHLFPSIPMNKLALVHHKTANFIGTYNKSYFEFYSNIMNW